MVPRPQIVVRAATVAEVLPFVRLACDHAPQGCKTAEELAEQGMRFVVVHSGEALAGYLLRDLGDELFMTACGARSAGFDLCGALDEIVMGQGAQVGKIGFQTVRRGLVRKAKRLGYRVDYEVGGVFVMCKNFRE